MTPRKNPTRSFTIPSTVAAPPSVFDELTGASPQPAAPAEPPAEPDSPPVITSAPAQLLRATTPARQPARSSQPAQDARVPIRVQVPQALADRVRGAIAHLQYREPGWESLNMATEAALEAFVAQAEQDHNDGQPFPWNSGQKLRPGRRIGHG